MGSRAPGRERNSCPNEDSEVQNEATLRRFHKACMQEAGGREAVIITIIVVTT